MVEAKYDIVEAGALDKIKSLIKKGVMTLIPTMLLWSNTGFAKFKNPEEFAKKLEKMRAKNEQKLEKKETTPTVVINPMATPIETPPPDQTPNPSSSV